MLVTQFNQSSISPFKNKENTHHSHEYEHLKSIIHRNEQMMAAMRKQLSQKVNKTQFFSALSAKVSLSDITNLTSNSFRQDEDTSLQTIRQNMEQQAKSVMKSFQHEKDESIQEIKKQIKQLKNDLENAQQNSNKRQVDFLKQLRQNDRCMMQNLQRKVQRSEFDKMMHLSSLLAIEFQLIKKRFGTFEVDYNLIWKEISNLYTNHQSLRSVFNTERKSSVENTKQKQVFPQTKTGNNCKGRLFGSQKEVETVNTNEVDEVITQINEKIYLFEQQQNDHEYSINNFGERLMAIERDYENFLSNMKEVSKLKKQYSQSKNEIFVLQDKARNMKEQMGEWVKARCEVGVRQVSKEIGKQIKQACEQISSQMLHLFSECAKLNETQVLRNNISLLEEQFQQKIHFIMDQNRKRLQAFSTKNQHIQDKVRLLGKDMASRVKVEQLEQMKQIYLTSQTAMNILKKSQGSLKKEINEFRESQSLINEVVCSQNILARWIWISGQLKGGNLISWDKETVNTLPENFIYNKPQMNFKVMSGGIYKLEMGFYAKKRPSIQIIINGKTIISAVNSSSYVVHHSSGKLKDITNSQIAGLTYYDYFTLPQNIRLAISYTGQIGHGFFGIQRL